MPTRNSTVEMTPAVENTRPRISRGVWRWLIRRPATNEGAFRTPDRAIRPIAAQTDDWSAYSSPNVPIPTQLRTSHWPSRRRSERRAMSRLPTTKPTEVRPSWMPYSNSVAWRAVMANGSSSTFWSPKQMRTGVLTRLSERRIGVRAMNLAPKARFRIISRTVVSSSTTSGAILTRLIMKAEKRNVAASIQKTTSIDCDEASSPASAKPTAVEPNWAMAMIEFAAPAPPRWRSRAGPSRWPGRRTG